ncbi:hypothetical protein SAMN04488115_101368 [Bosea lathyri]|uniref:Uncharacterized protein n=1 Tax=Bosea lathyri TaxID=1036778 RepID=A0A1H5SQB0_9HYPH|nr:hypothetical protein SAMN04488115_101368 [Bosea lathyri]
MAAKIVTRPLECKAPAAHQRNDVAFLPGPYLQNHNTARRQQTRELLCKNTVRIEPIAAAIKRKTRIMIAHLDRKSRNIACRNIGRVGDDEIESALQPLDPIALTEPDPIRYAIGGSVQRRSRAGSFGKIDPKSGGVPAFAQDRNQQAPRPRAQVEHRQRVLTAGAEHFESSLDQRLAIGTGLERRRRQLESEAPEFALAQDAPDRLACEAALGEALQSGKGRRIQRVEKVRIRICRSKGTLHEKACIKSRGLPASLAQARRKETPRFDYRRRGVACFSISLVRTTGDNPPPR